MNDIFVIATGGSGARVANAIAMLIAAGAFKEHDIIHILIIDAHIVNANKRTTIDNINLINSLHNVFNPGDVQKSNNKHDLALAPQIKLYECDLSVGSENATIDLLTKRDANWNDISKSDNISVAKSELLLRALYTDQERAYTVSKGYGSHPSLGVAFATAAINFNAPSSKGFQSFATALHNSLNIGDIKITLIGSLFGGTGAACLSSVVRILRNRFKDGVTTGKLNINGIFLTPYFSIKKSADYGENRVRSELFSLATKASLEYYADKKLLANKESADTSFYNSIYLLGFPTTQASVDYSDDNNQNNTAHFVELEAALALYDFISDTHKAEIEQFRNTLFTAITVNKANNKLPVYTLNWDNLTHGEYLKQILVKFMRIAIIHSFAIMPQSFDVKKNEEITAPAVIRSLYENSKKDRGANDTNQIYKQLEDLQTLLINFIRWCIDIQRSAGNNQDKSKMFDDVVLSQMLEIFAGSLENKHEINAVDIRRLDSVFESNTNISILRASAKFASATLSGKDISTRLKKYWAVLNRSAEA